MAIVSLLTSGRDNNALLQTSLENRLWKPTYFPIRMQNYRIDHKITIPTGTKEDYWHRNTIIFPLQFSEMISCMSVARRREQRLMVTMNAEFFQLSKCKWCRNGSNWNHLMAKSNLLKHHSISPWNLPLITEFNKIRIRLAHPLITKLRQRKLFSRFCLLSLIKIFPHRTTRFSISLRNSVIAAN